MVKNQVAYIDGHYIFCSLSLISSLNIHSKSVVSIIGNNTVMSKIGNRLNINGISYISHSSIIGYSSNTNRTMFRYYRISCIR